MTKEERKTAREVCDYCYWEILPGQKIYVQKDTTGPMFFDKPECVEALRNKTGMKFGVEERVFDPRIM